MTILTLLVAGVLSGCSKDEVNQASRGGDADEAQSPTSVEPQSHAPATRPVDDPARISPLARDRSSDDLALDIPEIPQTTGNVNINATSTPKILDDAFEVEEHFEDGSLKRRWFVRLYVTFDRSKPWHQQSPESWVQHGPFEEFYPGGQQRLAQGEFVDGMRAGTWTFWHPGGAIAKQGNYVAAQLEGAWKFFREDGTLSRVETYDAHRKHGPWKYYDADGETVLREERYVEGESIGKTASE